MVECPRCGRRVETLEPVPPSVVTPELVEEVGRPDEAGDIRTCEACVEDLTGAAP